MKPYQETTFWRETPREKQQTIQLWIKSTGGRSRDLFTRFANAIDQGVMDKEYQTLRDQFTDAIGSWFNAGRPITRDEVPPVHHPQAVQQAVDDLLADEEEADRT